MPPRDLIIRTRQFALAVVRFCRTLPNTAEATEAASQLRLEYLRDARIASNPELLQEAHEIASILSAAVKTARRNTDRLKNDPTS
jgi:hypothetical protein